MRFICAHGSESRNICGQFLTQKLSLVIIYPYICVNQQEDMEISRRSVPTKNVVGSGFLYKYSKAFFNSHNFAKIFEIHCSVQNKRCFWCLQHLLLELLSSLVGIRIAAQKLAHASSPRNLGRRNMPCCSIAIFSSVTPPFETPA